ncbi:Fungalysin metallopeptidase-domain-containing protein [Pholiota molesta]|nr:Fungalysin metallopeptidase-domain-containing protein [Pholiota molesta]
MTSFSKLWKDALLVVALASCSVASPLDHATRRSIPIGSNLEIEAFHPISTFETFSSGIDHPLSKRSKFDLKSAAISFVGSRLSTSASSVAFKSGFSGEVSDHAFLTQVHNGIPFANAVANVAFNKDNKVVTFGSSFVDPTSFASTTPSISVQSAISMAEKALDGTFNNHPPTIEFFAKPDNTAVLTHVVQIQNDATGAWFEAFVDAHSGELVSVTDFVTRASYLVLPMQDEILTQGFQTLVDPEDLTASPLGWHSTGTTNTTVTSGNNAISFKGAQTATTSESSPGLNFAFVQDPTLAPTAQANLDAARTNAFYVVNTMHDLTYKYGFTEASFNFQNNNFGKGGLGNDQVTISVQDAAGTNNADFATPADGQSGRMRMFLWTFTTPERDGALENDIVTHENTHGVTNRMTGGGTGRCLQTTEAGGMAGTSSCLLRRLILFWDNTSRIIRLVSVLILFDRPTVNPLQYSDLQTLTEVHAIGEVWANMLSTSTPTSLGSTDGLRPRAQTQQRRKATPQLQVLWRAPLLT